MAATATDEQEKRQQRAPGRPAGPAPRLRLLLAAIAAAGAIAALAAAAWLQPNPGMVEIAIGGELFYHEFPDIIADLKDEGRRPRYVKLGITVELPAELRPRLEDKSPEVIDALHAFLRERSAAELVGGSGADEVRAALFAIVNEALAPDQAKAVFFRQFILS